MHVVKKVFNIWRGNDPETIIALNSGSGSNRQYFRITYQGESFIGTKSEDIRENEAFFYLADYYKSINISVPKVHYISSNRTIYFQEDFGDTNLLHLVKENGFTDDVKKLYKDSLSMLWQMQSSTVNLDFSKCYPRAAFDKQSLLWDLNYFKYYFLKVSGIEFDEQLLENDLQLLSSHLAVKSNDQFFMFRDFQARNIQVHNNKPWFIDFQGGRRGPFLYDVASLLYQASAGITDELRNEFLLDYYQFLPKELNISHQQFIDKFKMMAFIRIIQTLGAYGYRGLIEGKEYFKNNIPFALDNLKVVKAELNTDINISYFLSILDQLVEIKYKFES